MTAVSLIGLDKIIQKLDSLEHMTRIIGPVLMTGMKEIREDARNQPPKRAGAFSALATDGQRRAYWAKVRSGEALHGESGYIRSNTLRDSWQMPQLQNITNGVRVTLENTAPNNYGVWVHGQVGQQRFHKASGFPTEAQLIEKHARDIVEDASKAIARELAK